MIYLLAVLASLAPAPQPRDLQVQPGVYDVYWSAGCCFRTSLGKDGSYRAEDGRSRWHGSYEWVARTRTLHIVETCDGERWLHHTFTLDSRLSETGNPSRRLVRKYGGAKEE